MRRAKHAVRRPRRVLTGPRLVLAAVAGATLAAVPLGGPTGAPVGGAQGPAPTCQGTTPLGLPGNWTCTFDDEFNGTSLDRSMWVPQLTANSGYQAGADCYIDDPSTISVSGGTLNLSVHQAPTFPCATPTGGYSSSYQAGMVSTSGLFSQTYGAFEVNAKLPAATTSGLQETFWLYPQTLTYGPWPSSGEIDFAEFYSIVSNLDIPFVHYNYSPLDLNDTAYTCSINPATFNTYEVDWTPTFIAVGYNGNLCLIDHVVRGPAPFNQPFFIALTQALGLLNDPFIPGVTPLPATTQVDWVRAWSPS